MRLNRACVCCAVVGLGSLLAQAQPTNEVEALRQQLRQMTETFEKTVQEQRRLIEELTRKIQALEQARSAAPATTAPPTTSLTFTNELSPSGQPGTREPARAGRRPSDPIRIGTRPVYMDIGLVGTFAAGTSTGSDIDGGLQLGGHDPNQRGFTVQGLELNLAGSVDPYFRGNVNVSLGVDAGGDVGLELEEAWLESLSLPANLQVRAGQMYTEFGRHNPTHLHTWAFVDAPLVNGRFLGPDGLRNPGARLAWLMPVPFFSELSIGVQDSHGGTAASFRNGGGHHHGHDEGTLPLAYRHLDNDRGVKHFSDLLLSGRYAASFELSRAQTLLVGASGAFGPNASGGPDAGDTRTELYGLDLTWKWKSPQHHGGFPFVAWQTEWMLRRYQAGAFSWDLDGNGQLEPGEVMDPLTGRPAWLPGETLLDWGLYTQLLYGFRKGWVAGLRLDHLNGQQGDYERRGLVLDGEPLGPDPARARRWRLSPNLTWYPSEYSKIRLQYNYDDRRGLSDEHSVWLQFEFVLGTHAAHKF